MDHQGDHPGNDQDAAEVEIQDPAVTGIAGPDRSPQVVRAEGKERGDALPRTEIQDKMEEQAQQHAHGERYCITIDCCISRMAAGTSRSADTQIPIPRIPGMEWVSRLSFGSNDFFRKELYTAFITGTQSRSVNRVIQ